MTEPLKSCPFCGERAEIRQTRSKVWPMLSAQCVNCLAHVEGYNEAEVTTAWNRRTAADAAPGEPHKLARDLRRLAEP